jgi:hypothetical protein
LLNKGFGSRELPPPSSATPTTRPSPPHDTPRHQLHPPWQAGGSSRSSANRAGCRAEPARRSSRRSSKSSSVTAPRLPPPRPSRARKRPRPSAGRACSRSVVHGVVTPVILTSSRQATCMGAASFSPDEGGKQIDPDALPMCKGREAAGIRGDGGAPARVVVGGGGACW